MIARTMFCNDIISYFFFCCMDITEIFINKRKTGTSKKIAHISADNIIRMLINGSIRMMGECTNAMQYDSLTTLLNFLKVTKVSKNMKMEGCASPKFIKSCLPESMIYTSEHMIIKHCPSNRLMPF